MQRLLQLDPLAVTQEVQARTAADEERTVLGQVPQFHPHLQTDHGLADENLHTVEKPHTALQQLTTNNSSTRFPR